jgi:hypothetical protein
MERRRAATVAGAAAATVLAAVLGLGATFGLFGLTEPPDAGGSGADRAPVAAVTPGHAVGAAAGAPTTARDD